MIFFNPMGDILVLKLHFAFNVIEEKLASLRKKVVEKHVVVVSRVGINSSLKLFGKIQLENKTLKIYYLLSCFLCKLL